MADFTPVALGVKPPQAMTLGDMVNIARGAQAYQQAEQANPLALQKAQMEIDQAKKMNPLAVSRSETELEKARIDALKAGYGLDDTEHSSFAKILGGFAYDPRLKPENIKKNPKGVMDVIHEMKAEGRASGIRDNRLDTVTAPAMAKAMQDPMSVPQYLLNMMSKGMTPSEQRTAGLEKVETTGAGQVIRTTPSTYGETPKVSYETPSGVTPMPNIVEINGAKYEISPPTTAGGQPILKPLGGGMTQQQGGTQQNVVPPPSGGQPQGAPQGGITPTQMQLKYPVRKAGDVRPFAPNEETDTKTGATYLNSLTTRQTDLSASRRNLDEVIDAAIKIDKEDLFSTGVLGALTRTVKGWAGDPKYKQLSKDLANVQISNIQAQGGSLDTVAGQNLMKMASGDETYPPDVLVNIARRTYSDLTNLDMQATAASKFAQKYGDSNLNTFKRMWSDNADSKVFEAMSIFENVKDSAKAKAEIDKLLGDNPKKREEFFKKYNNIKKLTATGEL
jgi:hypothetical protein